MNLSNSVDKKKAKNLLKLFRKTIPVMTLMDAYAIQAILHGREKMVAACEEACRVAVRIMRKYLEEQK